MSLLNRATSLIWAIEEESLRTLFNIVSRQNLNIEAAREIRESRESRFKAIEAAQGDKVEGTRRVRARDGIATIRIEGTIVRRADFFTEISGGVSVETLALDFNSVLKNDNIKSIVFYIDSPGGEVTGINEFAQMIFDARGIKPISAYVCGMCASGAYWIASACEKITIDATALLGSIGVIASCLDVSRADAMHGFEEIVVRSDLSPNKNLPPRTPEGRQHLQGVVNSIAEVFVTTLARNRGVTREKVISDFGQGGILVGSEAVRAGLADALGSYEQGLIEMGNIVPSIDDGIIEPDATLTGGAIVASASNGGEEMNLKDIKAWFQALSVDERQQAVEALKANGEQPEGGGNLEAGTQAGQLPATSIQQDQPVNASVQVDPSPTAQIGQENTDAAKLQAEIEALKRENEESKKAAAQASTSLTSATERIAAMEKETRAGRFTAMVEGRQDDGSMGNAWFGAKETHLRMLESLHDKFGLESDEFKSYVEHERKVAAAIGESPLFVETGTSRRTDAQSAAEKIEAETRKLMSEDKTLSYEQASVKAMEMNAALYESYLAEEQRG
jgi:signal peptide peptidase SppA